MSSAEETFIKTFLLPDRRERWLTFLASEKNRGKVLARLAHVFPQDLDMRFVHDKRNPPPPITEQVKSLVKQWQQTNPKQHCHIMALSSEQDGQIRSLPDIESDSALTHGEVIIIIPDRLAYYHAESDRNKEPRYVLFRQ